MTNTNSTSDRMIDDTNSKLKLTYDAVKISFKLKAKKTGAMPKYSGSLWRGLLGKGLYQFSCINVDDNCNACPYMSGCAYGTVIQPLSEQFAPTLSNRMKYLPPPLIVEAPYFLDEKGKVDEECMVNLIVYGIGLHYIHYIIELFFHMAEAGVGKNRIPFEIVSVSQDKYSGDKKQLLFSNQINYNLIELEKMNFFNEKEIGKVMIYINTPLRLQKSGEILRSIDLESFLMSCYRRLSILHEMANKQVLITEEDVQDWLKEIKLTNPRTYWENWSRFSSKKKTVMNLGGVLGAFQLEGNIDLILSLLKFASYFHIGKQTVFGLGKFSIWSKLEE